VTLPFERTRRGSVVILLAAVLISFGLIFATQTGAFLYAGIGLLMYYFSSRLVLEMKVSVLNRLEVTREAEGRVDEGSELRVKLTMVNRTMMRLSLEVLDTYPPFFRLKEASNATLLSVPARGYAELSYGLSPVSVGRQAFGSVKLVLRDIAGLFLYERDIDVPTSISVTPRAREIGRAHV
jgi:uncharacterized protein (DUF58 family)